MQRLLITGGSGYLGQHLVPLALQETDHLLYTYFSNKPKQHQRWARQLDVRDEAAVNALVEAFRPDVIIHTAGSNHPAQTMDAVIRQGASHITAVAMAHNARLIHLSTDVVFDGRSAPYVEADPPAPIHAYGRAKTAAEEIVARHSNHVIVRTSLIYGLQQMDSATKWVAEALRASEPVTLFVDQVRNPVWVQSLSMACLELVTHRYTGPLHVAGTQRMNRAEFGQKMLDWWGVDERSTLSFGPCDGQRWPLDCTLDVTLAQSLLQTPLYGVDQVLARGQRARHGG